VKIFLNCIIQTQITLNRKTLNVTRREKSILLTSAKHKFSIFDGFLWKKYEKSKYGPAVGKLRPSQA